MSTLQVNNRWLFTHIPKCGGTAIERALRHAGFNVKSFYPRTGHVRVADLWKLCQVSPERHEVVAVIRNPYARELSHWLYERGQANGCKPEKHRFGYAARHDSVCSYVTDPDCKFTNYYERDWYPNLYQPRKDPLKFIEETGYYRYWLMDNGEIPGKLRILHLERIDAELSDLLEEEIRVEPQNTTEHGEPLGYFDAPSRAAVERMYWWAFEGHYKAGVPVAESLKA